MARIQVLVFLVISMLGIGYVGLRYVGLGQTLLGGEYLVHARFDRAGGIFTNAPVTYRGVPVGRVAAVRLSGDGVRVDLRIPRGVRIPTDLRAVVGERSAVGEQYVDLRPNRDAGPYLRDGSVIPRERTGTPLPVEVLLSNLDALVGSLPGEDLNVLITELGTALENNTDALRRILDSSDALLADGERYLPQTLALIRDSRTVLTTQAEQSAAIRAWAAALARLTDAIRGADPDLRRLLANGPPAATELTALLRGLDPTIGTMLGNLITVNGIAARRLPGIEQILVEFPAVVSGGFTVAPGDGTAHFGLVVNANDPPPCVYRQTGRPDCTSGERAAGSGVRSRSTAPRPGGSGPAPAPDGGSGPAAGGSSSGSPAGGTGGPSGAAAAGYDPVTGMATGPDGQPLLLGSTGGQYRTAGDQSWKQLLLSGIVP